MNLIETSSCYLYTLLGLFSLAVGSLLNVIIYRLPLMMQAEYRSQCHQFLQEPFEQSEQVNLFFPRSFCPNCKKTIPAWHNIPLLSYLLLKGQCRYCQQRISFRYPLVEILSTVLSLYAAYMFGFHLTLVFALIFIWIIICLFFIDLEHQIIPDALSLSLLWLGLIANTQALFAHLNNAIFSTVFAYLFLWLLIKAYFLVTGKIGMGNGDFKLFAAFGAWFGWTKLPLILFGSSLLGAIIGVLYLNLTNQTKETPIPFGPFLCVAAIMTLFYGQILIKWYLII